MCANVTRSRTGTLLRSATAFAQKHDYQRRVRYRFGLGIGFGYGIRFGIAARCPHQFTFPAQSVRNARTLVQAMHAVDSLPSSPAANLAPGDVPFDPCFTYTKEQCENKGKNPSVAKLLLEKHKNKEFFYGLEITGQINGQLTCVDFHDFLPILPAFMSIVWLPKYAEVKQLKSVETLQITDNMQPYIPTIPHISLYQLTQERVDEFLARKFTDLLIVRGDKYDQKQLFQKSHKLVTYIRKKKASIGLCVAGHPVGIPGHMDMLQNIPILKKKMDKGADYVVTQICYEPEQVEEFVRSARSAGICQPIVVGVFVPDTFQTYELMTKISQIALPPAMLADLEKVKTDNVKVQKYFIDLMICIIRQVVGSELDIFGIQFYTMNRFPPVKAALAELRKQNILKPSKHGCGQA